MLRLKKSHTEQLTWSFSKLRNFGIKASRIAFVGQTLFKENNYQKQKTVFKAQ